MAARQTRLTTDAYYTGILSGDRVVLSKAITLVESSLASDKELAGDLIERILPHTGKSRRIGITGVPGVGKSTFIEVFGSLLIDQDESLAILTIDPSSSKSRGSILGDKTRMESLARMDNVFIRPSAAGNALGGVANATREAMLICEAAGFSTIIIETVGVGQSETSVRNMVDFFLLLMLAGAGDELQGIKKGIMEMADALVITKSDGANIQLAKQAAESYRNALHLFPPDPNGWSCKVSVTSALEKSGFQEVLDLIDNYYAHMSEFNRLNNLRNDQKLKWLHDLILFLQNYQFMQTPGIRSSIKDFEDKVVNGEISPFKAATKLLQRTSKK